VYELLTRHCWDKVAAVCGGNKTARETLWEHGCQECPEADLDSQVA
jgi:hypothetical protein